ncbi:reverse transcriptase domain-containing protein, partial [Tanacetum coccineum]
NIMDGINIADLTIEQYLWLTQEHRTPSMVKKVNDMTIADYVEYEERIKRQYNRNSRSYFPTYFSHYTFSNNITYEFPRNTYVNLIPPNTKSNYDYKDMELDEEATYTTDEESVMSEHEVIDPVHTVNTQSFEEELSLGEDLDEWLNAEMEKHMSKQKEKNKEDALIAIIKSIREEYASNNVMPRSIYEYLNLDNLGGAIVSVKMDDMTQQETLGTVKNVVVKINKFEFACDFVVTDMSKNLGEMIILGRPFLETIHAQIDIFQEEFHLGLEEESFNPLEIGHDLFSYESPACLQFEQDTRNYDTINPQNEIVGQTNPLLDKGGSTSNQNIPNNEPTLFSLEHSELEEKSNISESPKLQPFRPRPCDYSFDEWLKVKIGHTNIYYSDQEIVFNEWILDNFNVEEEYAKEFRNPYSRRFDEYKRVFNNEVENLSNEYTLRIGKKGYEEEELWRSGDEKTDYEPPFVDVKTFEVKKYSFKREQSFISITKQDDDALPLGRVNRARFKAMIKKELKDKGIAHDKM